jgi:hypothetical protein
MFVVEKAGEREMWCIWYLLVGVKLLPLSLNNLYYCRLPQIQDTLFKINQ